MWCNLCTHARARFKRTEIDIDESVYFVRWLYCMYWEQWLTLWATHTPSNIISALLECKQRAKWKHCSLGNLQSSNVCASLLAHRLHHRLSFWLDFRSICVTIWCYQGDPNMHSICSEKDAQNMRNFFKARRNIRTLGCQRFGEQHGG